jgi:hypothetical protein
MEREHVRGGRGRVVAPEKSGKRQMCFCSHATGMRARATELQPLSMSCFGCEGGRGGGERERVSGGGIARVSLPPYMYAPRWLHCASDSG